MDQALIQAKANYGYGKAGAVLGQSWTIYRPDALLPLIAALDARYAFGTLTGWLTGDPAFKTLRPIPPDKPVGYISIDRTLLENGDYLMDANQNVVFIGSMQAVLATPAIRCNRAFTITRGVPMPGSTFYGGNARANQETILTLWPGFVDAKNRGREPEKRIPGDTKLNTVTMMLPVTPGVQIMPNDILTDEQADPKRYTVSIATSTDWGWAIEAYYAGA